MTNFMRMLSGNVSVDVFQLKAPEDSAHVLPLYGHQLTVVHGADPVPRERELMLALRSA